MGTSLSKTVRFFIEGKGQEHLILSAYEQRGGDIMIDLCGRGVTRAEDGPIRNFLQNRFTVHPSNESPEGVTTINNRVELDDGTVSRAKFMSTGIKKRDRFVPVLFCAVGNPDTPMRKMKKASKSIYLGKIEEQFTLYYGVYVGARSRRFLNEGGPRHNVRQIRIGAFNFIFISSFLSVPAFHASVVTRLLSIPPNDGTLMELDAGDDEQGAMGQFWSAGAQIKEYLLGAIDYDVEGRTAQKAIARESEFFARGMAGTPEWLAWRQRMADSGLWPRPQAV